MKQLTLITRPGCHLCDQVRDLLSATQAELDFELAELSIDEHPALSAQYRDHIPVVLLDGQLLSYWTLTREQLLLGLQNGPDAISVPPL